MKPGALHFFLRVCLGRRIPLRLFAAGGFTLIELLIGVAIIAILAAIGIPMLQDAQRKSSYARAASDTKTAVSQAIISANDHNAYPRTLIVLRDSGYSNVQTKDPWNNNYRLNNVFSNQSVPNPGQEVWVCSQGPKGGGSCPGDLLSGQQPEWVPKYGQERLGRLLGAIRGLDRKLA